MALTATATPLVQDDICKQLGLAQPAHFIHGFRRDNIAIEAVEVAPSERDEVAREILLDPGRRPAIIYTPTRRQAESLAVELSSDFSAEAYHAGLDGEHRRRVQADFMSGKAEVIVATIAFGMGIDKPNIRSVIHTALPGSLEAYYQEIGRAGRDGEPSRAVLMHSYADRRTHDFFLERDYPDLTVLQRIFSRLGSQPIDKEALRKQARLEETEFDKALEKLWIHGGAVIDYAENVTLGHDEWTDPYLAHLEQKRSQIDLMIRFAESSQCRMIMLVRHFGDLADASRECGLCDFCAPAECVAQRFRTATPAERKAVFRIIAGLGPGVSKSTGKLHGDLYPHGELLRDEFEEVLGGMARAGLVRLTEASFEKDGRQIPYRKVSLTREALEIDETVPLDFIMKDSEPATPRRKTKKAAKTKGPKRPVPVLDSKLESALRAWRLAEAKRRGVPAFRILTDQVLKAIAAEEPRSARELLTIPGIGAHTVEKHGAQIFQLVDRNAP
jgi:superfamily II DNA helicase RecQ